MQDKLKYILLGIGGVVVLAILVVLGSRIKSLENDKNSLIGENAALTEKVNAVSGENKSLKVQVEGLNADLGKLKTDKEQLQNDYQGLVKEREELQAKIDKLVAEKESLNQVVASAQSSAVEPVTTDAYWGKVLKKKADLELQVDALRDQVKALKAQADQIALEKNSLTMELNNIKREGTDLQRQADYSQRLADTLTQDLAREKSDKMEIEKTLATLKSDNRTLRQQLQNTINHKIRLEQQLADLLQKNQNLEGSLSNMEGYVKQQMVQVDSLKSRIQESKKASAAAVAKPEESAFEEVSGPAPGRSGAGSSGSQAIQLPPIVVRPQGESRGIAAVLPALSAPAQISARGRVVSVDRDNHFVVIDLGKSSGLKLGDVFRVVRAGQPIADLSVIQVRDRISACDIVKETSTIMPGDQVL